MNFKDVKKGNWIEVKTDIRLSDVIKLSENRSGIVNDVYYSNDHKCNVIVYNTVYAIYENADINEIISIKNISKNPEYFL
jgi:hypothetical protein